MSSSSSQPELSLTDFVDVVMKSGTPKATKVSQIKQRPSYHPAFDFYKPIRESIIESHQQNWSKKQFSVSAGATHDPKKKANYPTVIQGYLKWLGSKQTIWFNPAKTTYNCSGVEVIINPELGLQFGGEQHLIKLYFKDEKLQKNRADLILQMMEMTLRPSLDLSTKVSVLDVRNSKLFTGTSGNALLAAQVNAELAYISSIWPHV